MIARARFPLLPPEPPDDGDHGLSAAQEATLAMLPPVLSKAWGDNWTYRLATHGGHVFRFAEIVLPDAIGWIRLIDPEPVNHGPWCVDFCWGRPIDLHVSAIAWIGDQDS